MSSGEKSILYFLIGILLQEEKDFYFIDEPENNLTPAIVSKLWNFIERERPNSVFVYLTHDSDLKDIEELKSLYNAERKSNDDIDKMAKKYIELHSKLVEKRDYSSILRHLDAKGIITQCRSLFKFGKTVHYEQQVFTLLNSDKGDSFLSEIRHQYLSGIEA